MRDAMSEQGGQLGHALHWNAKIILSDWYLYVASDKVPR